MNRLRLKRSDISTPTVDCIRFEEVAPGAAKRRGFRLYRVTARKKRWISVSTSVGVVPFDIWGFQYVASVALGPEALSDRKYCLHTIREAIRNEPKGNP